MNKMDTFFSSLILMGKGMLSIFLVIALIIVAILLLTKLTKNSDEK